MATHSCARASPWPTRCRWIRTSGCSRLSTPARCWCDPRALRDAYTERADYTAVTETDPLEAHAFFDHGMELSRRFRALKLWIMFKLRGVDTYRRAIADNIALREYLDARVGAEPRLERLASGLSISCFRYRREGAEAGTLDRLTAAT